LRFIKTTDTIGRTKLYTMDGNGHKKLMGKIYKMESKREEDILQLLKKYNQMSSKDISSKLKISTTWVSRLLRNMERKGIVQRKYMGLVYFLSPDRIIFSDIRQELEERIKKILIEVNSNKELIIRAFIAETGCKPSECELIEQHEENGDIKWYIRKKEGI